MSRNIPRIAILAGDGIGPEVITQARRVLDWFVQHRTLEIAIEEAPYGIEAYHRYGVVLPEATRTATERSDLVLFGATGPVACSASAVRFRFTQTCRSP